MKKLTEKVLVKVILGAGGVGKTTVSAVLGLEQAALGKRVCVITLDPARRLLDALGLQTRAIKPTKVPLASFGVSEESSGSLDAYMPNLKKEWQDFLKDATKNGEALHKIAENPFYSYVINGLPGALEVICSHILYKFMASGQYDVIVLDTPPSSNSIAFLDVPKKVAALLEQNIFRTIFSNKNSFLLKISRKLAFFSGSIIQNTLERLMGSHFLSEVIDFALSVDSLYEPMLDRSRMMHEILINKQTKYVLVCKPESDIIDDCINLQESLQERGIFISKIVVNQVVKNLNEKDVESERTIFAKSAKDEEMIHLITRLWAVHDENSRLQQRQIARLQASFPDAPLYKLEAQKPGTHEDILAALLADLTKQARP